MILIEYRWRIPPHEEAQFTRDWDALTQVVIRKYGAIRNYLAHSGNGEFIAIAIWPSKGQWERWREELHHHPLREKYRSYKVGDPKLYDLVSSL